MPEESPPLSPEEALKKFYMPPGYRVELVASEPLIQDPVMIDWDGEGRMWAVEMPGYMPDINAKGEHDADRQDRRARRHEQRRPHGQAHGVSGRPRPGALAQGARSRRARRGAAEPLAVPGHQRRSSRRSQRARHRRCTDDARRTSSTTRTACLWALDNNIYTSEIDIDLRLKNGKFEVRKTLSRGQWGITQDDAGRIFRNTNESALHVDLVPAHYYMRHPNLLRTRGSYESLNGPNGELNEVWPIRPTRGVNRGYQYGILRADGTLAKYTSVCAPMVYRGDRLPAELYGNVFVVDPTVNLVSRIILSDSGNGLTASKAYRDVRGEFLASTDERFRPVNLSLAPDGTLYVVDMYRGIIQHKGYMTEYLRDYVLTHKLDAAELVRPHLSHRAREHASATRRRCRCEPRRRSSFSCCRIRTAGAATWRSSCSSSAATSRSCPALRKLASSARRRPRAAEGAVGARRARRDRAERRDAGACRTRTETCACRRCGLSERWLRMPNHPIQGAVLKRLDDTDWAVRRQLAATLGELPAGSKEAALASILERHGDDPIAVDAALSGSRGSELAVLDRLLQGSRRDAAAIGGHHDARRDDRARGRRCAGADAAAARGGNVARDLAAIRAAARRRSRAARRDDAGDAEPRRAAIRMRRARRVPADAVVPVARARFQARSKAPIRRRRRRARAARSSRSSREPALIAVAAEKGELGDRAAKVMARIGWPGKARRWRRRLRR